jgi:acetylornithine deacetylase/succinyl-diaminopimelate desuccinylase-like protein
MSSWANPLEYGESCARKTNCNRKIGKADSVSEPRTQRSGVGGSDKQLLVGSGTRQGQLDRLPSGAMTKTALNVERLQRAVNRQRLVDTAVKLIAVPSRTGEAGAAADCLADILAGDGFTVERPEGGHPAAPAVAVRFDSKQPGRTLQFNGHLDTVHLPFVPPRVEGDRITGSGAADMKSGLAAAVEALRVLRETGTLAAGGILLTAHDLHEAPWGLGQQLDHLIAEGYVGDAVLLPEPLSDRLPVIGRGAATWKVTIRRAGLPVHEVMRPAKEPSVIAAGVELVTRLGQLNDQLVRKKHVLAGSESVFIGQIHSGEIYNQYPQECWLEGTRRWLPETRRQEVEGEFRKLLAEVERQTGTTITADFRFIRDAFHLENNPLTVAFQDAYLAMTGDILPLGAKPFVDDGNSFWALAHVPAITHGPRAAGQHTVNEWVSIDDLARVAGLYALTAIGYCREK